MLPVLPFVCKSVCTGRYKIGGTMFSCKTQYKKRKVFIIIFCIKELALSEKIQNNVHSVKEVFEEEPRIVSNTDAC